MSVDKAYKELIKGKKVKSNCWNRIRFWVDINHEDLKVLFGQSKRNCG